MSALRRRSPPDRQDGVEREPARLRLPVGLPALAGVAPIARVSIYDLVQTITSLSAGAEVISRGLQLSLDGVAELRAPGRVLNAAAAGQWVQEGMAAPVRALSFSNAATLRPRRLSVISVFTREMVESSNIEAIVRQTLGEATGLALDAKMFSTDAAIASAPAGLFAGVAPITPVIGGRSNAMEGDLKASFANRCVFVGSSVAID